MPSRSSASVLLALEKFKELERNQSYEQSIGIPNLKTEPCAVAEKKFTKVSPYSLPREDKIIVECCEQDLMEKSMVKSFESKKYRKEFLSKEKNDSKLKLLDERKLYDDIKPIQALYERSITKERVNEVSDYSVRSIHSKKFIAAQSVMDLKKKLEHDNRKSNFQFKPKNSNDCIVNNLKKQKFDHKTKKNKVPEGLYNQSNYFCIENDNDHKCMSDINESINVVYIAQDKKLPNLEKESIKIYGKHVEKKQKEVDSEFELNNGEKISMKSQFNDKIWLEEKLSSMAKFQSKINNHKMSDKVQDEIDLQFENLMNHKKHQPKVSKPSQNLAAIYLFEKKLKEDSNKKLVHVSKRISGLQKDTFNEIKKKYGHVVQSEQMNKSQNKHLNANNNNLVQDTLSHVVKASNNIDLIDNERANKENLKKQQMQQYLLSNIMFDQKPLKNNNVNSEIVIKNEEKEKEEKNEQVVLDNDYYQAMNKYLDILDQDEQKRKRRERKAKKEPIRMKLKEVNYIKRKFESSKVNPDNFAHIKQSKSDHNVRTHMVDDKINFVKKMFENSNTSNEEQHLVVKKPPKHISSSLINKFSAQDSCGMEIKHKWKLELGKEKQKKEEENKENEIKRLKLESEKIQMEIKEQEIKIETCTKNKKFQINTQDNTQVLTQNVVEEEILDCRNKETKSVKKPKKVLRRIQHIFEKENNPTFNYNSIHPKVGTLDPNAFVPKQNDEVKTSFKDNVLIGVLNKAKQVFESSEMEKPPLSLCRKSENTSVKILEEKILFNQLENCGETKNSSKVEWKWKMNKEVQNELPIKMFDLKHSPPSLCIHKDKKDNNSIDGFVDNKIIGDDVKQMWNNKDNFKQTHDHRYNHGSLNQSQNLSMNLNSSKSIQNKTNNYYDVTKLDTNSSMNLLNEHQLLKTECKSDLLSLSNTVVETAIDLGKKNEPNNNNDMKFNNKKTVKNRKYNKLLNSTSTIKNVIEKPTTLNIRNKEFQCIEPKDENMNKHHNFYENISSIKETLFIHQKNEAKPQNIVNKLNIEQYVAKLKNVQNTSNEARHIGSNICNEKFSTMKHILETKTSVLNSPPDQKSSYNSKSLALNNLKNNQMSQGTDKNDTSMLTPPLKLHVSAEHMSKQYNHHHEFCSSKPAQLSSSSVSNNVLIDAHLKSNKSNVMHKQKLTTEKELLSNEYQIPENYKLEPPSSVSYLKKICSRMKDVQQEETNFQNSLMFFSELSADNTSSSISSPKVAVGNTSCKNMKEYFESGKASSDSNKKDKDSIPFEKSISCSNVKDIMSNYNNQCENNKLIENKKYLGTDEVVEKSPIIKLDSFSKFRNEFEYGKNGEVVNTDEDIKQELETLRHSRKLQSNLEFYTNNCTRLTKSKSSAIVSETLDANVIEHVSKSRNAIKTLFESTAPKVTFGGSTKKHTTKCLTNRPGLTAMPIKRKTEQFSTDRSWVLETINKYFNVIQEDENQSEICQDELFENDEDETVEVCSNALQKSASSVRIQHLFSSVAENQEKATNVDIFKANLSSHLSKETSSTSVSPSQ